MKLTRITIVIFLSSAVSARSIFPFGLKESPKFSRPNYQKNKVVFGPHVRPLIKYLHLTKYSYVKDELLSVFINFRKAFDTVWHEGLWKRLWDCGIRGKAWRILRSLYSQLESSVILDGEQSRWVPLQQGVRQGCPLSPILFTCFIDDLATRLRNAGGGLPINERTLHSLLYADDVVLLADDEQALQQMIDIVDQFCRDWRLDINPDKSKVMVITPKC